MALTRQDATIIMGMLDRGDKNHDIAAWFGENLARVAEVKDGTAFGIVPAAPAVELPPKGAVGPKARRLKAYAIDALAALVNNGSEGVGKAISELKAGLEKFDRHEA